MTRPLCITIVALGAFAGCTPNAIPASAGGVASPVTGAPVQRVDVNLGDPPLQSAFGVVAGYAPNPTNVAVGTEIVFHNSQGFPHTASAIAGSTFPASSPFTIATLQPGGARLSDVGWTSGQLNSGASSQAILADMPGVYLFGCFFHYSTPMRGAIVVK